MNRINHSLALRALGGLMGLLCLQGIPVSAQQTDQAKPESTKEEVIVLSAFEVRSVKDSGYRVENSIGPTGFAQALLDTPLPITVYTSQFLNDTGKNGFLGALSYASSIALDDNSPNGNFSPGVGRGNGQPNLTRFRGQPYSGTFRNGLRQFYGFDTENLDLTETAN